MSFRDFWTNIRTSAHFLFPTVTADSPRLDTDRLEAKLRSASIWLTPKSVEGFESQDFAFLSEEERIRLGQAVAQFVALAQHVPPDEPATEEQVESALPPFQTILKIMQPDRYGDPDAFVIGKKVEQCLADQIPQWVRDLRFETGEDANGEPAIWIWVEVEDEAANAAVFSQNTRHVRDLIATCIRKLDIPVWPYVRFRTSSEQAARHNDGGE